MLKPLKRRPQEKHPPLALEMLEERRLLNGTTLLPALPVAALVPPLPWPSSRLLFPLLLRKTLPRR